MIRLNYFFQRVLVGLAALSLVVVLLSFLPFNPAKRAASDMPRVLDDRLQLTLYADSPAIVTPIGIAIDRRNRLFVLESHTHLRPSNYIGPATDLIKMMTDDDSDGHPDRITTFADGLKEGLNLAFSPDGHLYAVTSRAVYALYDHNDDGICDEKKKILELARPASVYAHAALLGITFSPDGWLYVSRGNTGGAAWKLVGTDGSSVEGYGDGGNIVRARPDGSLLEEVATGFWNPMDLKFDSGGHLLAADNDPDSRGPNRLVHVVQGADFGYQSLYGGSGLHPFLAWNGELPGTLPYAVGLGEAPSGLLNLDLAALPADYAGQMLSSVWEESRLVRIRLVPQGASVTGSADVLVEGDEQFRPVALATDQTGSIYITDWVMRDYPNHGHGRIWKLSAKPGVTVSPPRSTVASTGEPVSSDPLQRLFSAQSTADFDRLKKALTDADPFVRHAATVALGRPVFRQGVEEATRDANADVRLGSLLALQRGDGGKSETRARHLLSDPDIRIRQEVLRWIGQAGMTTLRPTLDLAMTSGEVTSALFDTYLETICHLMPEFQNAYRNRTEAYSKSIKRTLPPHFIEGFVSDATRPGRLRALAVRHLPHPEKNVLLLTGLLRHNEPTLVVETIRTMASVPDAKIAASLLKLVQTPTRPVAVRAEAMLALARQPDVPVSAILPLLHDASPDVRLEAIRYLRTRLAPDQARKLLTFKTSDMDEALRQQLALAQAKETAKRPGTLADWEQTLGAEGKPERGQRVFFSVQASCSSCHRMQGRGGGLGPDLDNVGRSKSRAQLIQAILRPSAEISPEWQGWYVRLNNGEAHQGRQIDVGEKVTELYTQGNGFVTFARKDIREYGLIKTSLMPDGLESQLTEHDLRDLVAFLQQKN